MKLNIFNMELYPKEEKGYELLHYKKYYQLKDLIKNRKPNMIIHGIPYSGKTYLIDNIFKHTYGNYKVNHEDKLSYKENNNYYIFNLSCNFKYNIIKKITSIVKNYDHFNNTIKYIVIDNYNDIQDILQKNIKIFIEKYSNNSRFILITNRLLSIDASTRNNCFNIRINSPNKYDKFIYFKYILQKNNLCFNEFLLLKNCEKYDINRIFKIYYEEDISYTDIYERVNNDIYTIMYLPFNINEIKKLSLNMKELNLDISNIFSTFFKNNNYSLSKNKLLIKEITHYIYIIKKAYRDIIPIETLLIRIYYILNYG